MLIRNGGAEEDRTPDLLRARQALSQLSYGPVVFSEHPELRAAHAILSMFLHIIAAEPDAECLVELGSQQQESRT